MHKSFQIAAHEIAAEPIEPALYLVATPIGNLSDITLRALTVITSADVLACEDTRVTRTLLERYAIKQRPVSYHEHNAARSGPKLLAALAEGRSVALISDAGTPLISDPGYRLVEQALAQGAKIVPVPGPSAVMAALVASGLPSDSFLFAGFLPVKEKARHDRLSELKHVASTLLFFESPRRLATSLAAAVDVLGPERPAAICRELTKVFEDVRRESLAALAAHYGAAETVKGEIVLIIGPPVETKADIADADALLRDLMRALPPAKAATEAARQTGLSRKLLYARLLSMKDGAQ
ncbi:MAG: 16S rRNA (cytidine(1402)-2'-O)-methyltransferase [Pseudomonadota bacterium]